ncbi:glycoside hydrolase family 57 [Candidatus Wolfebacteria bacterium]|nr:glycoside hydrolase family 57 [Candidatus Wolfebacteria bacterium]
MSKLNLYSVFHLNLAYSSLPEERTKEVIEHCYRPLLQLAEDCDVGIGIEAPAYTLERIKEIDPALIEKLKSLINSGKCEFVGSGYMQIIGPLVPAEVNQYNLKIGNDVYRSILGIEPKIAYVNEQAYSQGLISHYLNAGFETMIMEWNNPDKFHPEWNEEFQYQPQVVIDGHGNEIKVIWNNSIAFQKFQRYATGEIEMGEYVDYLKSHIGDSQRFFPIYGSDAEVFDFRTMRYKEEVPIIEPGEWQKIRELFAHLSQDSGFSFIRPSKVLSGAEGSGAFNKISLESNEQPIPVKKRDAYNLTRWSLTGRDDVGINTKCYRIYDNLINYEKLGGIDREKTDKFWQELCYLWGSDFRTHITEEKFTKYKKRLDKILEESGKLIADNTTIAQELSEHHKSVIGGVPKIFEQGRHIVVQTNRVEVKFNSQKGLAIESLIFKNICQDFLIGTLESGYYKDVSFAEDFFSGHTAIEVPMSPKIVDLEKVRVKLPEIKPGAEHITLEADISTSVGTIYKKIDIFNNIDRIDLKYTFNLRSVYPASFRSCILTFNPRAFMAGNLHYACHNGGIEKEIFYLRGQDFVCGGLLSHLVSSRSVLGNTSGCLEIGDEDKSVLIKTNMGQIAALPMINFIKMKDDKKYFLRTFYSLGEFDETSLLCQERTDKRIDFSVSIIGQNNK